MRAIPPTNPPRRLPAGAILFPKIVVGRTLAATWLFSLSLLSQLWHGQKRDAARVRVFMLMWTDRTATDMLTHTPSSSSSFSEG